MSAVKAGPAVPNWLAAGLIGIILGGVGGFYGSRWSEKPTGNAPGSPPGAMGGGGGLPPPGGGMGGPGGGGGAQDHPNAASLVRTVGNLAVLEKARGNELSPEQRQKLSSITSELTTSDTLSEAQCEANLQKINAVLSPVQQAVLEDLTPRFGRGGGGGGGRSGGPGGGPPGGNSPAAGNGPGSLTPAAVGGGGGGMGGGARTDWERPFKEGRGRERLDELTGLLKK